MILLSRIFKYYHAPQNQAKEKVITIKAVQADNTQELTDLHSVTSESTLALADAESKATEIIAAAEEEAAQLRQQIKLEQAEWESKEKQFIEQAQDVGYSQGFEAGKTAGYAEVEKELTLAKNVIHAAKRDYATKVQSAEATILQLGLKVAEKIIGLEIEKNEHTFLSIVKNALKEVRNDREVQVHVHPMYYELLQTQMEELLSVFPADTSLYIYPDEELLETACVIESSHGRLDASIDSQLSEVKQKLFELLERGIHEGS